MLLLEPPTICAMDTDNITSHPMHEHYHIKGVFLIAAQIAQVAWPIWIALAG